MKKKFEIDKAFEYGWDAMKPNFWFFASILAFVFIIYAALSYLMKNSGSLNVVLNVIYYFVCILISLGLIKIALKIYEKKRNSFLDIVNSYEMFLDYLIASVIYGVVVVIGLILIIVPGIILMNRLMFYPYLIVNKKMGPITALKKSWEMTKDHTGIIFIFWLMTSLINIIGVLIFGIGLFVSLPVTMMAQVYVYKQLSGK
jgi:uncharacterized membrane protein